MTPEERMQRIAALLLKGALRLAPQDAVLPPARVETWGHPDEAQIMAYVRRRGAAAPKDIRLACGLSRATTQRRLSHLVTGGHLVPQGKTHTLLYLLGSKPSGLN